MKHLWEVMGYTILTSMLTSLFSQIMSGVVTGNISHWPYFVVPVAACLSIVGCLWLRVTSEGEGQEWYRKGYEAGRWDQMSADLELEEFADSR